MDTLILSQLTPLVVLPAFLVSAVLFLVPGLVAALYLADRRWLWPACVVPLAIVVSCLCGYLAFWVTFFSAPWGHVFSGLVTLGSPSALAILLRRKPSVGAMLCSTEVLTPIALMGCTGIFYLSLLYSIDLQVPLKLQPRIRFLDSPLTIDDTLLRIFAGRLFAGQDPRVLEGSWHSGDRPPLQVGVSLLQFPLAHWFEAPDLAFFALGTTLQCLWVPAVWALWEAIGLARHRRGLALLFLVPSGFLMINSVFVWPKLFAGALTLFAVILVLFRREVSGQAHGLVRMSVLGVTAALASLAQGGVAFTLLPLVLFLFLPRYYPGLTRLLVAGLAYAGLLIPWSLYQIYYDPPGNSLLKIHLAGLDYPGVSTDKRSIWQTLVEQYGALSPREVLNNKLANFEVLFVEREDYLATQFQSLPREDSPQWPPNFRGFRRREFFNFFWALGILNFGWAAALPWKWRFPPARGEGINFAVLILALASLGCWLLMMFGPGTTVLHQGSYATFLLVSSFLAAALTSWPRWVVWLFLAVQSGLFVAGWLLTSPANALGRPNMFMIGCAIVSGSCLILIAQKPASK